LEVATSPADIGLDAGTLVEVKAAERHYFTSSGSHASVPRVFAYPRCLGFVSPLRGVEFDDYIEADERIVNGAA